MNEPMTAAEIARYAVAQAVWAPSVHNTQPWRFTVGGQQISLYADADRRLVVADPDGREMLISCGAALFNVRLALRSLGYTPQTCVLPDPGQPSLVAQVSWRPGVADEFERRLSDHMLTRRTHRGAFDLEPGPVGDPSQSDHLGHHRLGPGRLRPTAVGAEDRGARRSDGIFQRGDPVR